MRCPYCGSRDGAKLKYAFILQEDKMGYRVFGGYCKECRRPVVEMLHGKVGLMGGTGGDLVVLPGKEYVLWPPVMEEKALPAEIPENYREDLLEIYSVLMRSPKAAAALARRCLQRVLREEAKVKQDWPAREIREVIARNEMPHYLQADVEVILKFSNFSTHPISEAQTATIIDVEPEEAEWTVQILEELLTFYVIELPKRQARRDALNEKLGRAGEKPLKE